MKSLVQPLFDGPLDIIGDVHGEFETLQTLMQHLGYDEFGNHPAQRRMVFVGDLTDRGPDSPAVCHLLQRLIDTQKAQCVLGNHDLNLLLGLRKHDNGWFYGEPFLEDGQVVPQVLADDATRRQVLDLFAQLPIALERPDLKIVHACWHPQMVELARGSNDACQLYRDHYQRIKMEHANLDLDEIDRGLRHQNENPVKRLTSGPEQRITTPIHASGKTRYAARVQWWDDCQDSFVVFGHYSILDGTPRGSNNAFCVDYGVGKRWTERRAGQTENFTLKLAALRWPERAIVFDEGFH